MELLGCARTEYLGWMKMEGVMVKGTGYGEGCGEGLVKIPQMHGQLA